MPAPAHPARTSFPSTRRPPAQDTASEQADDERPIRKALPGAHVHEVSPPLRVGSLCHELAVHPIMPSLRPATDRGAYLFPGARLQVPSSSSFAPPCTGHAEALPQQLAPDLAHVIHTVVFIIHRWYRHLQKAVTLPTDCVCPDAGGADYFGNTSTGRYPTHGILIRPRVHRVGYPPGALFFPQVGLNFACAKYAQA